MISPRFRPSQRPATAALAGLLVALATLAVALVAAGGGAARTEAAPSYTAEPTISGSPTVGQTLTANNGTWKGSTPITFTYQWLRCDTNDSNCQTITGATAKTYVVSGVDVGHKVRVQVTATNSEGNASALANGTLVTVSQTGAPKVLDAPVISGTAATSQTLTGSTGLWSGQQPITYTFQWLRCDANGNNCVELPGATFETYVPGTGDVDSTLRIRVGASNALGSKTVISVQTPKVVKGAAPLPPGAITIPGGAISIPVTSVPNDQRLIVDSVTFTPNPVRSRTSPITVKVRVKDTRGYVVRDAYVFLRSTPILTSTPTDAQTAQDGTVTYQVAPTESFPLKNGYNVQFFVKAYRKGDPTLAGVSGSRLVQVKTAKP